MLNGRSNWARKEFLQGQPKDYPRVENNEVVNVVRNQHRLKTTRPIGGNRPSFHNTFSRIHSASSSHRFPLEGKTIPALTK